MSAATAETFHVVVAMVGYRNAADIVRCVGALEGSTHAAFELVICENGGSEAAAALRDVLPAIMPGDQRVTIIEAAGNLGYAGGVNVCLRRTPDADAWWVLNPDTQPASGALKALVEKLNSGTCDAVSGPLVNADGKIQASGFAWRSWLARGVALDAGGELDQIVEAEIESCLGFLSGASMLVGRRFVDGAGLMREDYFLYAEEVEWCLRATSKGLRLGFAVGGVVVHHTGSTTGSADVIQRRGRMPIYLDERNKILVTRDRFPVRLPVALVCSLGLIALRYARQGAWRQFGYGLQGWWAGLRNERGVPPWIAR